MSIKLLTNTVWRDCVQLLPTDSGNTATTDTSGIENVAMGPRHLEWTQSGSAVRRIAYVNKAGALSADTCIITRADRLTSGYVIRKYPSYPGSPSTLESSGAVPTCIGLNSQDYATSFTAATGQQALSLEILGSSAKTVNKVYFGNAIEFLYPRGPRISPAFGTAIIGRRAYPVSERASFVFEAVSQAQVDTLEEQWKIHDEPAFLWEAGQGLLKDGLWHCIVSNLSTTQTFHDKYTVSMEVFRLREYPRVS